LVSASGKAARLSTAESPLRAAKSRVPHDAVMGQISTRLRGRVGAITSTGILHIFQPMDLPEVDPTHPKLANGVSLREYLGLSPQDGDVVSVVCVDDEPTVMVCTAGGVVKRVSLTSLPERQRHSLITLKDSDTVVGASACGDDSHIVMITSNAQLLHFGAKLVRPQGLSAAGMTGIAVAEEATVIFAAATDPSKAQVITVSGSSAVLPGTEAQRIKRTALVEFPAKGRATGGVRAHSFLKGEDLLQRAYVGITPLALGAKGVAVDVPLETAKRDASGQPLDQPVIAFGEALLGASE
jgi:DNA gyrase subunit A